ncbi:MAG: hypothetical protein J5507_06555 [Clostridia bacterium]|nr:hypothetical protein [Clostridia bacterium]
MIAEVIIHTNAKELNKTYDYIIPDSIGKDIKIGSRVFVPFGRTKQEEGFVIGIKENSKFANKEIIKIEDSMLSKQNIELAKLMSKRYFCNISDCIRLMLPPGNTTKNIGNRIKEKKANFVYLKKEQEEIENDIEENVIKSEKQKRVLEFLINGNEGIHVVDLQSITDCSRAILNTLVKNGYIEIVEKKIERNPFIHKEVKRDKPLKLTDEQEIAYKKICESKFKEFLIYGVTGSRKNRNIFAANSKCFKQR